MLRTTLLITTPTALLVFVGGLIGEQDGGTFAFILAAAINFRTYFLPNGTAPPICRARGVSRSRRLNSMTRCSGWTNGRACPCPQHTSLQTRLPLFLPPFEALTAVSDYKRLSDKEEKIGEATVTVGWVALTKPNL